MESVWRALSSPHRRQILDLLKEGPKTVGQIARGLDGLSRFAVMQHLGVLEEAHLVITRKEGRERLNYSNPVPIRAVLRGWLTDHATTAAETALHLRGYIESQPNQVAMSQQTASQALRVVRLEAETIIRATPQRVYQACVHEMDAWWPHRLKADSTIVVDARPGGAIEERFTSGGGALFGVITMLDPENCKFSSSSPSCMNTSYSSFNHEVLEAHPEGTLHKKSMTLYGDVPDGVETMLREGMRQLGEVSLRRFVENGETYANGGRA